MISSIHCSSTYDPHGTGKLSLYHQHLKCWNCRTCRGIVEDEVMSLDLDLSKQDRDVDCCSEGFQSIEEEH